MSVHNRFAHAQSRERLVSGGTSDGYVALWDVGTPALPSYEGVNPSLLLRLFPDYGDVYNIAWSGSNRWLLAGTAAGLVGWNIQDDKVLAKEEYKPTMVDFIMPESRRDDGENPIVDSLAVASEWTIVSKCALHGLIYVWDLRATIKEIDKEEAVKKAGDNDSDDVKVIEQDVVMLANLRWSDTDNFYMNLGCHKGECVGLTMSCPVDETCIVSGKGLVACGDDKGSLWLYNQPQFGRDGAPATPDTLEPTTRLLWPELQDDHLENSRKVPLDRHDIIIDKVAASHDNAHIVAVTSNNMVCIWKRSNDDDSSTTASE